MLALASATFLASCSSTGDPIERLGLTPQQIEHGLRLGIDPVQVFEHQE
jgi:hypothetical protein